LKLFFPNPLLALLVGVIFSSVSCADSSEKPPKNPDFSKVTAEVDKNSDGKMSKEEWQKAGLPMSSFNMFEKGRGFVTQADYEINAAPPGIDINGDGFLTVKEFIEFDKKMSAEGPPGGPQPPANPEAPK